MKAPFLICLLVIITTTASSQYDRNLVAKFTFNNGTPVNEVNGKKARASSVLLVEDRFGNPYAACYLHGSPGSYLNLGTDSTLKPKNGTIALWVKMDMVMLGGRGVNCNPFILTKNSNGDDFYEGYNIVYNIDTKKVLSSATLSEKLQVQLLAKDTFSLRKWHHVACTYNYDSLKLYIDGVLNSSVVKNYESKFWPGDSVMIGHTANYKNERFLCGSVDDIMIYNSVLNANEIMALYNAPDPNKKHVYMQWLGKLLALAAVIFLLVWLFIKRYKRKLEKQVEQNRINARMNELETKAIRAQMNPHFVFNSLNTLQRFILEEDNAKAHTYLTKFSELLRKLLESGEAESISLKEEIEILNRYVEIEKLRFGDTFEYNISCDVPSPGLVQIPFMLIQPVVENAIWHGLLPKKQNQVLNVNFIQRNPQVILCTVEDNGVGRQKVAVNNGNIKKKSLAMDFIRQRLEIIAKATGIRGSLNIVDKPDTGGNTGTIVEILIPILL
jgi:hypothetical protein